MIYVRLDTKALTNGKLLAAGPLAFALYVKGLLYSKDHLLDGFIPANALPILALGMDDAHCVVAGLVKQGLWVETDGGWTVGSDRWAEFQTTASQVNDSKRAAAERKARSRDRAKSQQVGGTSDNCVTSDPCHANVTRDKKVTLSKTESEPESESETETGNTFTNVNGAAAMAEPCEVIELEIISSEPREALEPQVIEPEVLDTNPFPTVERIMTAISGATGQPPPTAPMIRRNIGKSSSILRLVEFCGEREATMLLVWCALHKPDLGYGAVWSNAQTLLAEAKRACWGHPPSKGKPKWGDPADDVDRMLSEHDKLLAARAEEDRYIRENW
jgi:hypothetical protein